MFLLTLPHIVGLFGLSILLVDVAVYPKFVSQRTIAALDTVGFPYVPAMRF